MRRHINQTSRSLVAAKADLRRSLPNFDTHFDLLMEVVSLKAEIGRLIRPPRKGVPALYMLASPTLRILYTFDDEWVVILNVAAVKAPA